MTPLASCQKSGKAVRPVHHQSNRRTRILGGAALVLGLLFASAEAATPLQADQYSGVSFDETDLPPLNKEFEFTVPDTSTATLRVTELGCPGDAFTVTSGNDVLFQTSPIPAENGCRDPFFLASAADAFADPAYSTGSIDLPAGTYLVRVSPFTGATSAAIGFFINDRSTVSTAEQSPTVSSVSEQPILSDDSSTENPTAVTLTITDQVTETATVPDSITDAPTATKSTAEGKPVTPATGISTGTEEIPIEASTKPALPVVTTTSFTTTTVTVTNPVTLTSGNATTTTFVVATKTVSAIPTLDVVTLTVETILYNTLTVIGNRTIGGITLTSTAVVTQTEVVTVLPTTTVPPSGVTTEYVTTEVTSLDDIPTNLPAPTGNATETLYITQYETIIVTGAASEQTETMTSTETSHATTVEPETSASDTAKPSVGSPTSHLSTTESCTVPVVTETAIITLTSTVVRFTDKLPSISTAFATATVKGETTVTKIPTDPVGTAVPRVGSQGAAKEMTPSKWLPTWITRFFPRSVERVRAAKVEPTYDVVTVTAEAPTRVVTVSENCEVTTVSNMAPSLSTKIESSTTELGTASESTTNKISMMTTEISDSTTVEPETSTAITSAEVSETSASEVPTPTDIITSSVSATAEPSSTTESASPSTTTDSTPSFPAVLARCNGKSPYLSIITSPSYLYKDANEACSTFGYGLAKISSFKETTDANAILVDCQIDRVWIKASSANMVNLPQCYAISQDQIYEPDNCENGVMQVLCATP